MKKADALDFVCKTVNCTEEDIVGLRLFERKGGQACCQVTFAWGKSQTYTLPAEDVLDGPIDSFNPPAEVAEKAAKKAAKKVTKKKAAKKARARRTK